MFSDDEVGFLFHEHSENRLPLVLSESPNKSSQASSEDLFSGSQEYKIGGSQEESTSLLFGSSQSQPLISTGNAFPLVTHGGSPNKISQGSSEDMFEDYGSQEYKIDCLDFDGSQHKISKDIMEINEINPYNIDGIQPIDTDLEKSLFSENNSLDEQFRQMNRNYKIDWMDFDGSQQKSYENSLEISENNQYNIQVSQLIDTEKVDPPVPIGYVICHLCSGLYLKYLKNQHMLGHDQRLPVQLCEQCQLAFFRPANLIKHREEAHGGVSYQCIYCPQRAPFSRGMLHFHLLNQHGIRRKCIEEAVVDSFAVKAKCKNIDKLKGKKSIKNKKSDVKEPKALSAPTEVKGTDAHKVKMQTRSGGVLSNKLKITKK